MDSGIVIRERGGYILRASDLEGVVELIRQDIDSTIKRLSDMAKEVDTRL